MLRLLRSRLITDYGMAVVLLAICVFLAIWTRQPGPAVPGQRGTDRFMDRVTQRCASQDTEALLILPTDEQLTQREIDPPLDSNGNPIPLMEIAGLHARNSRDGLFAEVLPYSAQRREMSLALRAALQANPRIAIVGYVDQTHERIAGIVATVAASLDRAVEVVGPPRSTVSVFLRRRNLINIARQISVFAVIAVGMTMVMLTGGIDLSVGSLVAFLGVIVALTINRPSGIPWWTWSVVGVSLGATLFWALGSRCKLGKVTGGLSGGVLGGVAGLLVGLATIGSIVGIDVDVATTAKRATAVSSGPIVALYVTDCEEMRDVVEAIDVELPNPVEGLFVNTVGLGLPGKRTGLRDELRQALEAKPDVRTLIALDPVSYELAREATVGAGHEVVSAARHVMGLLLFAVLFTVVVGAITGAFSGVVINCFRVPPFIATLALMQITRGLAYTISKGRAIPIAYDEFVDLIGRGFLFKSWLGDWLPIPVVIMAVAYLLAHIVLGSTRFGRYLYAVGGNEDATRLSGIPVGAVRFSAYVITGIAAALGGVIVASKLGAGDPNSGMLFELYVIAACVVGGTRLQGGEGKILGTLIGALLLGVLNNGLTLLQVDTYLQMVVIGTVILVAVLLDQVKKQL